MKKIDMTEIARRLDEARAMLESVKLDVAGFVPDGYESDKAIAGIQTFLCDTIALLLCGKPEN